MNGPESAAQDPLALRAPDRAVIAFAAVWDVWQAPGGAEVASLATVTCAPNADVAAVHDRMPGEFLAPLPTGRSGWARPTADPGPTAAPGA